MNPKKPTEKELEDLLIDSVMKAKVPPKEIESAIFKMDPNALPELAEKYKKQIQRAKEESIKYGVIDKVLKDLAEEYF